LRLSMSWFQPTRRTALPLSGEGETALAGDALPAGEALLSALALVTPRARQKAVAPINAKTQAVLKRFLAGTVVLRSVTPRCNHQMVRYGISLGPMGSA